MKPYGGKWLAQGDVDVVEGACPGSVILMEFPSRADAENWYESPEYQKIVHPRINNAISDLILVGSVSRDFTVAGFPRQVRAAIATASSTLRGQGRDQVQPPAISLPQAADRSNRRGTSHLPSDRGPADPPAPPA